MESARKISGLTEVLWMVIHDFRKVCIKCVSKTFLLRAKVTGIPITVSFVLQPFLSVTFSGGKDLSVSHKTPLASEMLILNNLNFKGSLSIIDKRCFKLSVSCSYSCPLVKVTVSYFFNFYLNSRTMCSFYPNSKCKMETIVPVVVNVKYLGSVPGL